MNKQKQPGIKFDSIILVEDNFKRERHLPNNLRLALDFNITNNNDNAIAFVELETKLSLTDADGKSYFTHNFKYVGRFSAEESDKNMELAEFIKISAPALVFPYIREHITYISGKAGITPIILPPLNIIALLKKKSN